MSTVYLYHLETPLGGERHSAQHYIGSARNLDARDAAHRAGRGSHFTRAAVERGIGMTLARTWTCDGDARELEYAIKAQGYSFAYYCPVCSGAAAERRGRKITPRPAPSRRRAGVCADLGELPSVTPAPADWYEWRTLARWRRAGASDERARVAAERAAAGIDAGAWDDGLL